MPIFPEAGPFNPQAPLVIPGSGIVTPDQMRWFLGLSGQIGAIQTVVNNNLGTNFLTLGSQPSLGPGDVGYVMFVTDFAHLVYWDGAAWQWLDGDRPYRFDDFGADPGVGWGLCDGTTYDVLVVGGVSLTTASLTTPDLAGSPTYKKSAAAYTGTITAASAPGASGSISGQTGTRSVNISGNTGSESATTTVQAGVGATVPASPHFHPPGSLLGDAHDHDGNTLVSSVTVDATGEPRRIGMLPYVRL